MLAWLQRYQLLILVAVVSALLGAIAVQQLEEAEPRAIVFRAASPLGPGEPIQVQVAGAVQQPGVYELRAGDRLADALAAAGGPRDEADLEALNLARHLRDGERITVAGGATPETEVAPALTADGLLDINRASRSQLMALPGVGEAYSRRIIDSRQVDGPFASVDELLERNILPQSAYDQIRDLVTAAP